jgi:hypothetical protein
MRCDRHCPDLGSAAPSLDENTSCNDTNAIQQLPSTFVKDSAHFDIVRPIRV